MTNRWICTICGLPFTQASHGGPGVCPSCDCGNWGFPVVERQRKEIERLRAAFERIPEENAELRAALEEAVRYMGAVAPDVYHRTHAPILRPPIEPFAMPICTHPAKDYVTGTCIICGEKRAVKSGVVTDES